MTYAISTQLGYLGLKHLNEAVTLLCQAYHDDQVFQLIFEEQKKAYEQKLRALFREELELFWQNDQPMIGAFENGVLIGVACINTPESPLVGGRFRNWRMKMLLSAGLVSTGKLLDKEQQIRQAMPVGPCHQLNLIAVMPEYQGTGVGTSLLEGVRSLVEDHQTSEGCGIFANQERSIDWLFSQGYMQLKQVEFSNIAGVLMFSPSSQFNSSSIES